MSLIKTKEEIEKLRKIGKVHAEILRKLAAFAKPGITTMDLENLALEEINKAGMKPAFKGYRPDKDKSAYPAALCTSINQDIVHCAPHDQRALHEGDLLSIDLGITDEGLFTDAALSVGIGELSEKAKKLVTATREALAAGIKQIKPGNRVGDIAAAVEAVGKKSGLGVVRDLVGHGVGHAIWEAPAVPNYGKPGTLEKLKPGMVIAVEPMFTLGDHRIKILDDGWSIATWDGSLAAHFEHTIAITEDGHIVLTE